jgi:hypothetical protein
VFYDCCNRDVDAATHEQECRRVGETG